MSSFKNYKKFGLEIFVLCMLTLILVGVGLPTYKILEANEWFGIFR